MSKGVHLHLPKCFVGLTYLTGKDDLENIFLEEIEGHAYAVALTPYSMVCAWWPIDGSVDRIPSPSAVPTRYITPALLSDQDKMVLKEQDGMYYINESWVGEDPKVEVPKWAIDLPKEEPLPINQATLDLDLLEDWSRFLKRYNGTSAVQFIGQGELCPILLVPFRQPNIQYFLKDGRTRAFMMIAPIRDCSAEYVLPFPK